MAAHPAPESFSEKGFYLAEFRGRILQVALRAEDLPSREPLAALLSELADNGTRVVLLATDAGLARGLTGSALDAAGERLEGAAWRALGKAPHVGISAAADDGFLRTARETAQRLGIHKLVYLHPEGGLRRPDGSRLSFVDAPELRRLLRDGPDARRPLLREVEMALAAGVAAVNLCSAEGLADELFSYAGSGTLFTRERYVVVRALGLEDYDLADDLVTRGVAEGYLAPRTPEEVERVLVAGFGAFVEGRHLAGIGALLEHASAHAGEIASLYTVTRFLREGVGSHLVRFALDRARHRGLGYVFACTTSEAVVRFFEREGFRRVGADEVPAEKWAHYDAARRARVHCLRVDL